MHRFTERRRTSESDALRLLIVEDDTNYRGYITILTRRLGFIVDAVPDGNDAVTQLGDAPYDVAIIDQEMPRMTGLELVARIRAGENTRGIYTLMLTGRDDMETKLTALNAGFDDFLTKASSELELVAKLVAARRIAARQRTLDTAVRELYGIATRDELTGVFNRRLFMGETERLLAGETPITVILFDLDEFKKINDTYGHLAGDRVLRDIGSLFLRSTRSDDLVARYGGDEFVMAVVHLPVADAERIAERLANDVRALRWTTPGSGAPFGIDVTTGIAASHLLTQATIGQLLNAADQDLYKNKWLRTTPDARPELYEYPAQRGGADLVLPLPTPSKEPGTEASVLLPIDLPLARPDAG